MADTDAPSYEDILACCKLGQEAMRVKCSDEVLSTVAEEMNEWRNIDLGIKRGKISGLKHDSGADDLEKRREYLQCWKQKYGPKATYELLARRFVEAGRADLAQLVCEECKKKSLQQRDKGEPNVPGKADNLARTAAKRCAASNGFRLTDTIPPTPTHTEPTPFIGQATGEEPSSRTRGGGPEQVDSSILHTPVAPTDHGGSEYVFMDGRGSQPSNENQPSRLVPGTSPPNLPPQSPLKSENEAGWLRRLVMMEKEEKGRVESKLDELAKRKEKLDDKFSTKCKEYDKLEREARDTQAELKQEQKRYADTMEELKKRNEDIKDLKQSLEKKDGELKLQKERDELKKVLAEQAERIRELKEEWKKDRREVNVVREEKQRIENFREWTDVDVKHYKAVMKRMKSLENQRTVAIIVVVVILPLIIAHVILV